MAEAPNEVSSGYNSTRFAENNKKALEFIKEVTKKADKVQKGVLVEILSQNANVEYLLRHGLNGHTDRETFKKIIPVITYEDILPDIARIANGDKSQILCCQPISEFLTSSSTSAGERKLIPTMAEELESIGFFIIKKAAAGSTSQEAAASTSHTWPQDSAVDQVAPKVSRVSGAHINPSRRCGKPCQQSADFKVP
ncbi:OLC1v1015897C1 [Oldenlandia corymbosa var. corymbosa]|uniref:OLC1v1015897C1 n=1 Tax=Oldenlandia corymbosa var. corymbosa TaxID=529605 RepID=A0AAV1E733_OLDCO|nr:OLC1v1015897C1 [Oldenlandia corymbosa var. corymbosa]